MDYFKSNFSSNHENDNFDMDHKFIKIYRGNLYQYFKKHGCNTEEELEDILWNNYGLTIKIV